MKGDELKKRFEFLMRSPSNYVNYIEKNIDIEFRKKLKRDFFISKPKLPSFSDKKNAKLSDKFKESLEKMPEKSRAGKSYVNFDDFLIGQRGTADSPIHNLKQKGRRTTQPSLNNRTPSPISKNLRNAGNSGSSYFGVELDSGKSIEKNFFLNVKKSPSNLPMISSFSRNKTDVSRRTESSVQIFNTEESSSDHKHTLDMGKLLRGKPTAPNKSETEGKVEGIIKINNMKQSFSSGGDLKAYTPVDVILKRNPGYLGTGPSPFLLEDLNKVNNKDRNNTTNSLQIDIFQEEEEEVNGKSVINLAGFRNRIKRIFNEFDLNPKSTKKDDLKISLRTSFEKRIQESNGKYIFNAKSLLGVNLVDQITTTEGFLLQSKGLSTSVTQSAEEKIKLKVELNNSVIKNYVDKIIKIAKNIPDSKIDSKLNMKLEDMIAGKLSSSLSSSLKVSRRSTSKDFLRLQQITFKVMSQLRLDPEFIDSLKFFSEDPNTATSDLMFHDFFSQKNHVIALFILKDEYKSHLDGSNPKEIVDRILLACGITPSNIFNKITWGNFCIFKRIVVNREGTMIEKIDFLYKFFYLGSGDLSLENFIHVMEILTRRNIVQGESNRIIADLFLENLKLSNLWDGISMIEASAFKEGLHKRCMDPNQFLRLIFEY